MDQEKIQAFRDAEAQRRKEAEALEAAKANAKSVADRVTASNLLGAQASAGAAKATGDRLASEVQKVQNAIQDSQDSVAQAINNLMLATVLTKDPRLAEAADNVANLLSSIADAGDKFGKSNLNLLPVANKELAAAISQLSKSVREKQEKDLSGEFDRVVEALNGLEVAPVVNVPKQDLKVDLSPITDAITALQAKIKPAKIDIPKVDFKEVISGLNKVQETISNLHFPVSNYVLPFKNTQGAATQVQLDSSGKLPVAFEGDIELGAVEIKDSTSDNRTSVINTAPTTEYGIVTRNIPSGTQTVSSGKTLKTKTGSASATFTIVAAVTSKKIKVYSLTLFTASTTAVTVTFKDGAAGTVLATYPLQAITGTNFGVTENMAAPSTLFETTAGNLLEMSFSAAQTVTYNLRYFDDDAS
jgi:hypothetical protein